MATNLFGPLGINPALLKGVDDGVVAEIVKSAYRTLARVHHPDKGGDAKRFAALQEAFSEIDPDANPIGFDDALKMARRPSKGLVAEKEAEIGTLRTMLQGACEITATGIRADCDKIVLVKVINRFNSLTAGGTEKESHSFLYRVPVAKAHLITSLICRDVVGPAAHNQFFRGKDVELRVKVPQCIYAAHFNSDGSIGCAEAEIVRFDSSQGVPAGVVFPRGRDEKCFGYRPGQLVPIEGRLVGVLDPNRFPVPYTEAMRSLSGLLPMGRRATSEEVKEAALGFSESQFQPYLSAFSRYIQIGSWLVVATMSQNGEPRLKILGAVSEFEVDEQAPLRLETAVRESSWTLEKQREIDRRHNEMRMRQALMDLGEEVREEALRTGVAEHNEQVWAKEQERLAETLAHYRELEEQRRKSRENGRRS